MRTSVLWAAMPLCITCLLTYSSQLLHFGSVKLHDFYTYAWKEVVCWMCMRVCVCVCVRACVRACVRVCVVCLCVYTTSCNPDRELSKDTCYHNEANIWTAGTHVTAKANYGNYINVIAWLYTFNSLDSVVFFACSFGLPAEVTQLLTLLHRTIEFLVTELE